MPLLFFYFHFFSIEKKDEINEYKKKKYKKKGKDKKKSVPVSPALSFRDISCHLGTIPSIVTFYICTCRKRQL
jgi:quinol-cytochrome oxidoreductase complex cytochrome b subunit